MLRAAVIVFLLAPACLAQEPPAFEVASVKPSKPGTPGPTMRMEPGGRFTADGITLRNLITLAFHVADEDPARARSSP